MMNDYDEDDLPYFALRFGATTTRSFPPTKMPTSVPPSVLLFDPTAFIVRARYFLDSQAKVIGRFRTEEEADALVREKRSLFIHYWDGRSPVYPEIAVEPVYL